MKFKGYFLKIIVMFILIPTFYFSCTDLDEEVYSQLTEENFFKTDAEVLSAMGNAYSELRYFMDLYTWLLQSCTSDETVTPPRGADWLGDGMTIRLTRRTWTPKEPYFSLPWGRMFSGVNTCNRLIHQMQLMNPNNAENYIAELRAIRALYYYWLVDMWGNVPIVDSFDVPDGYSPANNSRLEVFQFIETEILDVLPNLSKDVNTSTYGRANYWMVKALLAKLYLNAEVFSGTAQWQKAVDVCNEIITSGNFYLAENYFDNFKAQNQKSPEAIFSIPYDQIYASGSWQTPSFPLPQYTLHYSSQSTYNMTSQPFNGTCVQPEFFNLFEDNDVRKKSFIYGPQFTSSGEPLTDLGIYDLDTDGSEINFTPDFPGGLEGTSRQAGARIGKWEIEMGNNGTLNSDFFVFRYSDILITKAEALWRMNPSSQEALSLINQIRERAQVEPFTELTPDNMLEESGRELFFEMWRRSDLIRYDQWDKPTFMKPNSSPDYTKLFPIPASQIDANPNLVQNPGY